MFCDCMFYKRIVHRLSFEEFLCRYQLLLPASRDTLSPKASCLAIISEKFGLDDKENLLPLCRRSIKIGKHKVFLKEKQLEKLEKDRRQLLDSKASCIQRSWRLFQQRRHRRLIQRAAVTIQAGFRGWKARMAIQEMNEAAKVIQHALLVYCIRREQERLDERYDDQETADDPGGTGPTDIPINGPSPQTYKFPMFPPSLFNPPPPIRVSNPLDGDTVNLEDEIDGITDFEDDSGMEDPDTGRDKGDEDRPESDESTEDQEEAEVRSSRSDIMKDRMTNVAIGIVIAGLLWNGPIRI